MYFESWSSGWVLYWCSRRFRKAERSANETKVLEVDTRLKSKLSQFFSAFINGVRRREKFLEFEDVCIKEEEEVEDVSTQFLQTRKN